SNLFLNESNFILKNNETPHEKLGDFDFFIVGSDQVWNPHNLHGTSFYFLDFAPKEKRISYSASFGIDSIPEKYEKLYIEKLSEMSHISVREHAGANIVKKLTGTDAPVLVDPTMLLTKDEWLSLSKRASNRPKSPYMLTYFLGGPNDRT